MINVNGKTVTILGFGVIFLMDLAYLCSAIFGFNLDINIIYAVALLITAGGFGIQWLSNKENIDLLSAGTVGIVALISLIQNYTYFNGYLNWVMSVASSLYFFVMAVRAIQINKTSFNKLVSFACICAGIYYIFASHIVWEWLYPSIGFQNWIIIIWNIGYVVCSGSCLLECLQEN
ncbi:MAG: hypothetical protein IJQ28_01515 [Clostridia bacterium]|nr:hypothetical protein [Clostridia bacterium]